MTIKEYKQMMFMECSMVLTTAQAVAMMSIEAEHEAEATAGGKYDVDPEITERIRVAGILAKPFKVYSAYVRYDPYTDGAVGNGHHPVAGFDTYADAEAFVSSECRKGTWTEGEDCWPEIQPKPVAHHFTAGKSVRCDECGDSYDPNFWAKHSTVNGKLVHVAEDDCPF